MPLVTCLQKTFVLFELTIQILLLDTRYGLKRPEVATILKFNMPGSCQCLDGRSRESPLNTTLSFIVKERQDINIKNFFCMLPVNPTVAFILWKCQSPLLSTSIHIRPFFDHSRGKSAIPDLFCEAVSPQTAKPHGFCWQCCIQFCPKLNFDLKKTPALCLISFETWVIIHCFVTQGADTQSS